MAATVTSLGAWTTVELEDGRTVQLTRELVDVLRNAKERPVKEEEEEKYQLTRSWLFSPL